MYICINCVTPVFCFPFLNVNWSHLCWEIPNPIRKTQKHCQAKNKDFSVLRRQGFNCTATICGHHKRLLRSAQTSKAWNTTPQKRQYILLWLCFTVASIDVRICYLYFHECIHFQHGWAEQWECDQLSDVTVLYMGSEALSWAVEVAAVLQSLRHHHRLIRINILTGCLW